MEGLRLRVRLRAIQRSVRDCVFVSGSLILFQAKELADGVMKSMSSARQSEVKAWEEEIVACEHTLTLDQYAVDHTPANGMS